MTRKTHKGFFSPRNPDKYAGDLTQIVYRSGWEKKLMIFLDNNSSVLTWMSETTPIPYFSQVDGKMRRYFPDFYVKYKNRDGDIVTDIIEVKPFKETIPPKKTGGKNSRRRFINESITFQRNTDKWDAAKAFAAKHNMTFRKMTEYELGYKKRK